MIAVFEKNDTAVGFTCSVCGDEYTSVFVNRHTIRPICDACIDPDKRNKRNKTYQMPPLFDRNGIEIIPEIKRWTRDKESALALLMGKPGRGKTTQVHHVCKEYHEFSKTYNIISDNCLCRKYLDSSEYKNYDMLCIDEIGRRSDENVFCNVNDILDLRMPWVKKTIIVTNLDLETICEMDTRLFSRLKSAKCIILEGEDRRKMR